MAETTIPFTGGLDLLNQDEFTIVSQALAVRGMGANTKCDVCGEVKYNLNAYVMTPVAMAASPMPGDLGRYALSSTVSLPSVAVVCMNCGNTKFFNMIVLGIRRAANA
jgi:hypothetical protein